MRVLGVSVAVALSLGLQGCSCESDPKRKVTDDAAGAAGISGSGSEAGESGTGRAAGGSAGARVTHDSDSGSGGQVTTSGVAGSTETAGGTAGHPDNGALAGAPLIPPSWGGAAGAAEGAGGQESTGGTASIAGAAGAADPKPEACALGYRNGPSGCEDLDECENERDNCDANATCTNTPGSWSCSCNEGYFGNGQACETAQPCATNTCQNGGLCWLDGSARRCECPEGFGGTRCETTCPDVLTFAHEDVEAAVRSAMDLPEGDILLEDAREIAQLSIQDSEDVDLSEIQCLTGLTSLTVVHSGVTDLTPLSSFALLTQLDLTCNDFLDLSPLKALVTLTELRIGHDAACDSDSRVSDLSPLASLSRLTTLSAYGHAITDLLPLSTLRSLTELELADNPVVDLSPLGTLSTLEILDLSRTTVNDLSPVGQLPLLRRLSLAGVELTTLETLPEHMRVLAELDLRNNDLVDLWPLAMFTELTYLNLADNPLVDLSPLAANTGLGSGDTVVLTGIYGGCASSDVAELTARGVNVTCSTSDPLNASL